MAYANFAAAWADFIADVPAYVTARQNFGPNLTTWSAATTVFQLRVAGSALFSLLYTMINQHTQLDVATQWQDAAHYAALWYAGQGGAAVTMDEILTAMLTAEYDQLQKFIGIEDAYRSAIWDQPFNAEFYAALARGFRP